MNDGTRSIITDNRFAIIPHWIIFSSISDGALRLYAVLTKYADNESRQAFPSRATLAKDIKKSPDSVDRYIKELEALGALKVQRRKKGGSKENYANLYTLITSNPQGVAAEVRLPGGMDAAENYTHLTTPNFPNATDSRIHEDIARPAPYGAEHSLHAQLGITEEQKNRLLDHLEVIYARKSFDGMDEIWDVFVAAMEEWVGVYVEDALSNKRWAESIPEKVTQALTEGKSVRYALGRWLGGLTAWCRLYA